jgi:hypothetical protein
VGPSSRVVASARHARVRAGERMPHRVRRRQCVAPRSSLAVPAWALSIARAILLLTIALLPVQMRAGASEIHPHSILQLVLDAQDGAIDHHGTTGASPHAHETHVAARGECLADPDLPSVEETGRLGGISILSVPVILLLVPVFSTERPWLMPSMRHGRQPELDPPPPRAHRA